MTARRGMTPFNEVERSASVEARSGPGHAGRKRSGSNRDLNERERHPVPEASLPSVSGARPHLSDSESMEAAGRTGLRHAVRRPTLSLLEEVWRWISGRVVPRRGQPAGRRRSLTEESRPVSPCGFPPLVDILSEGGIKRARASVERGIPQGGKLKGETGLIPAPNGTACRAVINGNRGDDCRPHWGGARVTSFGWSSGGNDGRARG